MRVGKPDLGMFTVEPLYSGHRFGNAFIEGWPYLICTHLGLSKLKWPLIGVLTSGVAFVSGTWFYSIVISDWREKSQAKTLDSCRETRVCTVSKWSNV